MKYKIIYNRIDLLRELISLYYSQEKCITGGRLHIILDDGNMKDDDISFCRGAVMENNEEFAHVKELAICILDMLESFSEKQRKMFWDHDSNQDIIFAENPELKVLK